MTGPWGMALDGELFYRMRRDLIRNRYAKPEGSDVMRPYKRAHTGPQENEE